jgi:hypothetical protein
MPKLLFAAVAAVVLLLPAMPAHAEAVRNGTLPNVESARALLVAGAAQAPCGAHDLVLAHLGQQYRERIVVQALQDDGRLLELLASPDGGTWTALVTRPDGVACIVAAGRHLVRLPPAPGDGHGL